MNENLPELIISTIKSGLDAISETTSAIAKIDEIKRTTGISKRQSKKLILEGQTYSQLAISFAEFCEEHPGILYEEQIGNLKLSNIGQILDLAKAEFAKNDDVPKIEFNEEWLFKFLDTAGETSDLEKQTILAKVLAGELRKPDCISYRTLRILKDLSKKDLQLFAKAISFSFHSSNELMFIPRNEGSTTFISYSEIMILDECGLMDSSSTKVLRFDKLINFTSCRNNYLLKVFDNNGNSNSLECYYFTNSALELLPFISVEEASLDIIKENANIFNVNNKTAALFKIFEKDSELTYNPNDNLIG